MTTEGANGLLCPQKLNLPSLRYLSRSLLSFMLLNLMTSRIKAANLCQKRKSYVRIKLGFKLKCKKDTKTVLHSLILFDPNHARYIFNFPT